MVQIDDLVLRISGLSEEQAQLLGKEVGKRIAANMPEATDKNIPELNISINASGEQSTDQLASAISEQIIRQLKLATL